MFKGFESWELGVFDVYSHLFMKPRGVPLTPKAGAWHSSKLKVPDR